MRFLAPLFLVALLVPPSVLPAQEGAPSPAAILRATRRSSTGQKLDLRGSLQSKPADVMQRPVEASFRLVSDGGAIRYIFTDPEPLTLTLRIGETSSELSESRSGRGEGSGDPTRRLFNTDLTYEDLALKFLYWARGSVEGTERMKTRPVWRLRLLSPGGRSSYASVLVWVDQESGALFKAEGFNAAGKPVRRFEVLDGQVINRAWYLKRMRVETFDPGTGKVISRTSMDLEAPKE